MGDNYKRFAFERGEHEKIVCSGTNRALVVAKLVADDGVATASADWPYPRGDVCFLRYRGSELDDGVNCTTGGLCGRNTVPLALLQKAI